MLRLTSKLQSVSDEANRSLISVKSPMNWGFFCEKIPLKN